MSQHSWEEEFPADITVCDTEGVILAINAKAALSYEEEGGKTLIGSNLLDCHPEPARSKLEQLLEKRQANIYTIEKNGRKKLIYQSPWYQDGRYCGFIELALPIPAEMPHFVRD